MDVAMQLACEQAVLAFTGAFDLNDVETMVRYFAADGVWHRHDGDIAGVEGLRAFMRARNAGIFVRHVLTNMRTTVASSTQATVESYVTVYRHDFDQAPVVPAPLTGPDVVARYRDQLTRGPGGWQLSRRDVRIDFKQRKP
jgi:limonene-1,2-epoxide hydrolase